MIYILPWNAQNNPYNKELNSSQNVNSALLRSSG